LQSSPVAPQPACRAARRTAVSSGLEQGDGDKPEEKVSLRLHAGNMFAGTQQQHVGCRAATATSHKAKLQPNGRTEQSAHGAAGSRKLKSQLAAGRTWRSPATKVSVGLRLWSASSSSCNVAAAAVSETHLQRARGREPGATQAAAQQLQRCLAGRLEHAACWSRSQVRVSSSAAAHATRFQAAAVARSSHL
jgi:hypothetical protein